MSCLSLTLERWGWRKEGGEVSCILSHSREVGWGMEGDEGTSPSVILGG